MIRRVTAADIGMLAGLQEGVEKEDAIIGYRADPVEEWTRRDLSWTLLATQDGAPVGLIYCVPRQSSGECVFPAGGRVLEIMDLIVAEPHRRRGLGHELVAVVRDMARGSGFTHMRVYSAARRFDDIVRFYRSCGFTPWYLEMVQEISDR